MSRRICRHGSSPARSLARHRGFSLIELMIAMALSLVVLGGAIAIFVSSRATYETTDRLSRLQDNGRFALDTIVRDLRAAGYLGCARSASLNNLLAKPDDLQWNFEFGVQGLDAQDASWAPALDGKAGIEPAAGSDILVVHSPRGEFEPVRVVAGWLMASTTDDIVTADETSSLIRAGDIVQISDCNARSVFQVTNAAAGVVSHAVGGDDTDKNLPGNASDDLNYAFTDAAELVTLNSVVYYIAPTPDPETDAAPNLSLFRRVSGRLSERLQDEELAPGIENMQLLFGELDGDTIDYRRADQVGDWNRVQTVRVALLVRSTSQFGTDRDNETYELLDTEVQAAGDRYLRQVFTTTVGVRNNPS